MDPAGAQGLQNLSPQQKDELMKNVEAQVALANMEQLLSVSNLCRIYCFGLGCNFSEKENITIF